MGWKVLIVEDEDPAREELVYLLGSIDQIVQIDQANTGMEAMKKAKEMKPDLIFLDIELPDINGLQFAELITEMGLNPKIVFATAYDQYAVDAFKIRAFHYILKPYDEKEIREVIREVVGTGNVIEEKANKGLPVKLAIEIQGKIRYVAPIDIIFISKEGKYCTIRTKDHTYEAQYTLQELEEKLNPFGFFRCHKSYLINLEYILEMTSWLNGAYNLLMADKGHSSVPVSRNYAKDLRMKLEI